MNTILTVSPSPHIFGNLSARRMMLGVMVSLIPAFLVTIYIFGLGAVITTSVSVLTCVIAEMLIQKFLMHRPVTVNDGSAVVTGILLAFNLPSNLPWWMVVIGSVFAIGVAKMAFGGLGNNPFNPALAGRIFLLISFPVQMTSWPLPLQSPLQYTDAVTGATPLGILKEGIRNGDSISVIMNQIPDSIHLFLGQMGGSLGEVSALALIIGFAWLLYKKIITWHIPVFIVATIYMFTGILWIFDPASNATPIFHILTGGVLLGAIYMATDLVTSPMTRKGMIIYAMGIGIITVVIRRFGIYPEGISFAILIMNAAVPIINKYVKPGRFGKEVQRG
jgi:Na+-translocating ferredoxin:NAD+ oxidoreductase subunit D